MKILVLCLCLVALVNLAESSGCTWLWVFTSTVSTVEWDRVRSSHGTLPTHNFTTEFNWWDVTTTTEPLKSTPFAVSHALVTTPPIQPEVIESTDTIFLIIILVSCLIGLIVTIVLVYFICQMTNRKHKKTKRLRVKPLKADQAFMQPAMPMGMGMGLGMDPMGMGGLMPPMDTGMMPGAMDPYGGMDPNAMAAGGMGGDMGAGMGGGMPGGMGGGMPGGMGGGMPGDEKQWMM